MAKNKNSREVFNSIVLAMGLVIMVVIFSLIISSVLTDSTFTDIPITGTATNETLVNVTNITISEYATLSAHADATCVLSTVYNSTGGETLTAGNYTATNCRIVLVSASTYIGSDLNVTYSYSYASGNSLAGVNATAVAGSYGDFVTNLIAFLAVIGTILGIVWLVVYVKRLFNRKEGLQGITA